MKKILILSLLLTSMTQAEAGINAKDGLYLGGNVMVTHFDQLEGESFKSALDMLAPPSIFGLSLVFVLTITLLLKQVIVS